MADAPGPITRVAMPHTATSAGADPVFSRDHGGSWLPMWRVIGAIFVAYPVLLIILAPPGPLIAALALAATAAYALMIGVLARRSALDRRRESIAFAAIDLGIIGLAMAVTMLAPNQGWVPLFYYGSTAASLLLPERRAVSLIVIAGAACAASILTSDNVASAVIQGLSVSIIGITVFAMAALRRTNAALAATRQELATLAVIEERNRIARDLHDVLGHSLSVIAIKSELAGRLLPGDPERARAEIADIERVARESLAGVRETVGGYRQPTLDRELANARVVLDAAGIEPHIEQETDALAAAEDAVLAWAVREAVTNLVRHSAASHATIRTSRDGTRVRLEVTDDGRGATGDPAPDGNGLAGLRERLELVGGRLDAGPLPEGGYRLVAAVPISSVPVR